MEPAIALAPPLAFVVMLLVRLVLDERARKRRLAAEAEAEAAAQARDAASAPLEPRKTDSGRTAADPPWPRLSPHGRGRRRSPRHSRRPIDGRA